MTSKEREREKADEGNIGARGISESRGTKEKEKTIRRTAESEDEEMAKRRGEEEDASQEEGPRGDRYWRRSNNGLFAMIIEHEAAGTLLKSTENRAGGFTCRINFYLVPSLPRPLVVLLILLLPLLLLPFYCFFLSALTAANRFSWSSAVFPVYRHFFREEAIRCYHDSTGYLWARYDRLNSTRN